MNLQETIRRILREEILTKSTNKEFNKYKDSKFHSLRKYTFQDIVDNWEELSNHKNHNIQTIKFFVENPDEITELTYDEKGLEDGYHRLIASKILNKPRIKYTIQENIITEGKQVGILYHSTSIQNIFNIIEENKLNTYSNDLNNLIDFRTQRDDNFMFHPLAGPIIKDREKYPPYISFTRNKNYKRSPKDTTLVIDGNKLSERYKIIPYSHFGGREKDEMEERVYRDIINLNKYIIKVILPFENEELESLLDEKDIRYEIK
jgi:hypothetical protein